MQLTEEQQLRGRRIRRLCEKFVDTLSENGISVWEVINEHGALTYISQLVQGRPIMPFNEVGQPAVYAKKPVDGTIKDLEAENAPETKPEEMPASGLAEVQPAETKEATDEPSV